MVIEKSYRHKASGKDGDINDFELPHGSYITFHSRIVEVIDGELFDISTSEYFNSLNAFFADHQIALEEAYSQRFYDGATVLTASRGTEKLYKYAQLYAGAKALMTAFSESARRQLKITGISPDVAKLCAEKGDVLGRAGAITVRGFTKEVVDEHHQVRESLAPLRIRTATNAKGAIHWVGWDMTPRGDSAANIAQNVNKKLALN